MQGLLSLQRFGEHVLPQLLVQVTVPDALGPVAPEDYRSGYPPVQTMPVEYQGDSTPRARRVQVEGPFGRPFIDASMSHLVAGYRYQVPIPSGYGCSPRVMWGQGTTKGSALSFDEARACRST